MKKVAYFILFPPQKKQAKTSFLHEVFIHELTEKELKELTTPRGWLSDTHMNLASTLLRRQFKDIGGFMGVGYSPGANYPKPKEAKWIQILHSPGHWLVVAKGFFESNTMRVYDR